MRGNSKIKRLLIGQGRREFLLRMATQKYEYLQIDAAQRGESLNKRLNALIDKGLQVEGQNT